MRTALDAVLVSCAGYMGAQVGLAGVLVKGRVTRGGQTFEVPVLLSSKVDDWRLLVGAYVVPPLLYLGISRLVVRPLAGWAQRRATERAQAQHREEVMSVSGCAWPPCMCTCMCR